MKKVILLFFVAFLYAFHLNAQQLDAYKYVIVPKTYEFLKIPDKYQLNSLTKFLFDKKGFETVWEGESYPAELISNPCLGLKADVINESNLFTSKVLITLTDCYNKEVYRTALGKSKEKEFKKSYHEALRRAFASIAEMEYHFDPGLTQHQTAVQKPVTPAAPVTPTVEPEKPVTPEPVVHAPQRAAARSFTNGEVSFFLIDQNGSYSAYVNDSKVDAYKKGELIGTLQKTSLPNVFRVSWKNKQGAFEDTTGYFDDNGNLKVDMNVDGKIETALFVLEK